MTEKNRPVIQRNELGDFVLTSYGEFLSYYHAHIQIFKKIVTEKGKPVSEAEAIQKNLKNFMVANVKNVADFSENVDKFAVFLEMSSDAYNAYMSEGFIPVLSKIQEKLIAQEIEARKSINDSNYSNITEELVEVVGVMLPGGFRFVMKDDLLVLENMSTGKMIEPEGMLAEIKKERQKEAEKLERKLAPKPKIQHIEIEKPILTEIVETVKELTPNKKIDASRFDAEVDLKTEVIIPKVEKPKGVLEDIPDLDFEEEVSVPVSLSQIEAEVESPSPGIDSIDLDDILSAVPDEAPMETEDESFAEEEEEAAPDEADTFTYAIYSEIVKRIQGFKVANDQKGHLEWMNSLSFADKSVVSIRNFLAKEAAGEKVDWAKTYSVLSEKSGLEQEVIVKLKNKVKHFDFVRSLLDYIVKEFKSLPPDSLNIAKSGWQHILKTFENVPDYDKVEADIDALFRRVQSETVKQPVIHIIKKGINKLRENYQKIS
jgi:hypothetical protein